MQDHRASDSPNFYVRMVVAWVERVARRPAMTLLLIALTVGVTADYAADNLRMNSDNTQLVRQDAPFRQNYRAYLDRFPQLKETSLLVLTGDSVGAVSDARDALVQGLSRRPDLIASIYAPGADPFFEDHAFLLLDETELEDTIERLARAQPALTALLEDPSLRGLFAELELGVESLEEGDELPTGFVRMARRVADIGEGLLAGRAESFSWADELQDDDELVYRMIVVQGRVEFGEPVPSARLVSEIRRTAEELGIAPENGVELRLTGWVPLAHEELETVQSGLAVAGVTAMVLLIVILGFGLRSLRIIVATLVTLGASLSWTTAYAMATVGEFNTISASFAVLMLGLGVDFGVHIGLRYEEETCRGVPVREALSRAAAGTGAPISLCALSSAIGFAAFIPTEYRGLAAFGVIAGGGMFFSLIASFTVFPAVLALMGPPTHRRREFESASRSMQAFLDRHAGKIVISAGVLALVTGYVSVTRIHFDFSTLALKNPNGEGMTTLRELQRQEIVTDYSITALATGFEAAERLALELEALPEVVEARPPSFYVPDDQEIKLEALEDASFFLEPVLYPNPPVPPPTEAERLESMRSLRDALRSLPAEGVEPDVRESTERLASVIDRLLGDPSSASLARQLEELVVADLGEQMDWLARALAVEPFGFDDLPADLRSRLISEDGLTRVVALPSEDVSQVVELRRFVRAVEEVVPDAAGRPVVEAGIGSIVVRSFRLAILIAFASIFGLLLITLRNVAEAFVVLMPITLAALITVAFGIVFDVRFNMANVVAIPLVLGLGVDSGIHVFVRYKHDGSIENLLDSSTPRAVLLSALTTLAAFGSLSLSGHEGIRGLGILLSVSLLSLLYCTLIVLPAVIVFRNRGHE